MVSQIVLWCDRCFHAAEQAHVFGEPAQFGWDRTWREVHLCGGCREQLFADAFASVVEFFTEFGEVITAAPATVATAPARPHQLKASEPRLPCLFCPQDFAGNSGLSRHITVSHKLGSALEVWGKTCPLCGRPFERLAQHTAREHNLHVSLAFAQAVSTGDPYKAAARQQEAALS